MGAILEEIENRPVPVPPGGFTRQDFEQKFNLTRAQANRRLDKLQAEKKVKRYGSTGRSVYYMLTD